MTENMSVMVPEDAQSEVDEFVAWADAVVVMSDVMREDVLEIAKKAKNQKKMFDELFNPNIKKADALHKDLVAQKKKFTSRLVYAEGKVKDAVIAYDKKQDAIREDKRRKEQAIKDAETRREQERLRKEADALKTPELKQARLEEAESLIPPTVQVEEAPKTKGAVTKRTWKARIINDKIVPREYMTVNVKALNALAKATKGSIEIDGVQFYEHFSLAIGG